MEITCTIENYRSLVRVCLRALILIMLSSGYCSAQPPAPVYTVKHGRQFIVIDKSITDDKLGAFISQFDLQELYLNLFLKRNQSDSLRKHGWEIEINDNRTFVISKPLSPIDKVKDFIDGFISDRRDFDTRFPVTSSGVHFGINQFKNKFPFAIYDSIVIFYLKNNLSAKTAHLAGSFNDWSPTSISMTKTDSGWIARMKLRPGKYWYKFIVNGQWQVDYDNSLRENDGEGNINSVFFRTNQVFRLDGYQNAKKVFLAGSFNDWKQRELPMKQTANGWELPLYLANGTHTYKFIVDGRWIQDDRNPKSLPDGSGGLNSVISIGKAYLFKLDGFQTARKIYLTGNFNEWRKDELQLTKTSKGWELPYVLGPGNYQYQFIVDGKSTPDPAHPSNTANPGRTSNLVIEPNHTFRLKGFDRAKSVLVAGDFNGWATDGFPMKKVGDEWVVDQHLSKGKHLYKFVVDMEWIKDPANKYWEQNEYGTGNSVLWK